MLSNLFQDIKFAFRVLTKRLGFSSLAVFILALGIGANIAIFSVINGLLISPLPYKDSNRLVHVWNTYPFIGLKHAGVSVPDYLDRKRVKSFQDSGLLDTESFNLILDGNPQRLDGAFVTASVFTTLQVQPSLGRIFSAEEEQPGADSVVLLSHNIWRNQFGSDMEIVGRDIQIDGAARTVVGIMPRGFTFPNPGTDVWVPLAFTPEQMSDAERGNEPFAMIARLQGNADIATAQKEIDAIHAANKERFPERVNFWESSGFGGTIISFRDQWFGSLRDALIMLQIGVLFVLLIACANIANLLLTRVNARQRELAIRSAIGAGRARLARQLLIESLILAVVGGIFGVLVGFWGIDLLQWFGINEASRGMPVAIDLTVLAFAFFLAVATGLIFGVFPVISLWRTSPGEYMKEGGRSQSGRSGLSRAVLVVTEVALALTLLIGAGLLGKSFNKLQSVSPGFTTENVLTAQIALSGAKYSDLNAVTRFFDGVIEEVSGLPGVSSVSASSNLPFTNDNWNGTYGIEDYVPSEGDARPHAHFRVVDEKFFDVMDIPLLRGRSFLNTDVPDSEFVAVVDQTMVDKYWRGQNPIGKRIEPGWLAYRNRVRGNVDAPSKITIVGVVSPITHNQLGEPIEKETIFVSRRQFPSFNMALVVKTSMRPETLIAPIRNAVLTVDPEQPVHDLQTMDNRIAQSLQDKRTPMLLLLLFSGVAVILSAVGIYGVLAFSFSQRIRELGTRVALGAQVADIFKLVISQGMKLTVLGLIVGLVASFGLMRLIASMLFGVDTYDPAVFLGVTFMLAAVALFACYVPARRATKVDPMEALRYE
ncbi:MAG: ABC transporter permease [Gammaproteobacteria bacterium]|nr:ABC transporter permease [Gammaproteobacteria bacterium]